MSQESRVLNFRFLYFFSSTTIYRDSFVNLLTGKVVKVEWDSKLCVRNLFYEDLLLPSNLLLCILNIFGADWLLTRERDSTASLDTKE